MYAKRDVATAGPTARTSEAAVCAMPFTLPSARGLFTEEVMYRNMQPEELGMNFDDANSGTGTHRKPYQ